MSLLRALTQTLSAPRPRVEPSAAPAPQRAPGLAFRDGFETGRSASASFRLDGEGPADKLLMQVPPSAPLEARSPVVPPGVPHVVRAGESLVGIVEAHLGEGASEDAIWDGVGELCELNGITDARNVFTGETLWLPVRPGGQKTQGD